MKLPQDKARIGAVVLAAGASRRMGQPKMLLRWGNTSVIGRVIQVLNDAGIVEPVVVTGRSADEVQNELQAFSVRRVHNPDYEKTEMLQSLQLGLTALADELDAFLVVLGDQPQIELAVVRQIIDRFEQEAPALIIPSYQMRRGHPWLVRKDLWESLRSLPAEATMRTFINQHADQIEYLNVDTSSILMDLDTPEDYSRQKPVE
jgi:molybdenum cofactor cytidylyltransferase